jgi:hypothetical protein
VIAVDDIRCRYHQAEAFLDERGRRLFAANEAQAHGFGGVTAAAAATGLARSTINRGIRELQSGQNPIGSRVRRPGGGRKSAVAHQPDLPAALEALIEDAIRGDPCAPLRCQLVGDFKNAGRELRPQGQPEAVRVHDFKIPELGKVAPYGVYDIAANHGWVSVGIDADTGAFAVESIRRWWHKLGQARYPDATCLTITADCGGSNGAKVKLWKRELQRFANETGLTITVTHLPPGTSKWNKIEHRLFAFITQNWRGKPLVSHAVIVQLIGATTTETGLQVCCEIDASLYPKGVKVTEQEMQALNLLRAEFHGEWNYTIALKQQPP